MKFFACLFFVLVALIILAGVTKQWWYPCYQKCFVSTHQQKPSNPMRPWAFPPQQEKIDSQRRLKHALADSDFVIYPTRLTLLAIKDTKTLEVWGEKKGSMVYIASYPFTATSGTLGPKLKEGDKQIPEGIYGISYLNPNSKFHLSMKIDYPNLFDKTIAKEEGRDNLGGDIMIHGKAASIGCVAIGDDAIEELFFLAQKVEISNIKVILAPIDFRRSTLPSGMTPKPWVQKLYSSLAQEMSKYKR